MRDDRRRENLFIKLAVVLVLVLIGRLLWPYYGERVTPVVDPVVVAAKGIWAKLATRAKPPTPPPAPAAVVQAPPVQSLEVAPPPPVVARAPEPAAQREPVAPPTTGPAVPPVATVAPTPPNASPELTDAAAKIAPPPPGTADIYLRIDPRVLAQVTDRGLAAYQAAGDNMDARIAAARAVHVAAVLGYGPARGVIARSYPRSHAVRVVATIEDAVRFALDAFAVGSAYSNNPEQVFTALATYLIDQGKAEAYTMALVDTLRDDTRMHDQDRLRKMFETLAAARGACEAIAQKLRWPGNKVAGGEDCLFSIRTRTLFHIRDAGRAGLDEAARREALARLPRLAGAAR